MKLVSYHRAFFPQKGQSQTEPVFLFQQPRMHGIFFSYRRPSGSKGIPSLL